MREYRFDQEKAKQSVTVPPELLEQIADDVRAFDRAQSEETRTRKALGKLAAAVERLADRGDPERLELERRAVEAAEVQALAAAYVPRSQMWESPLVRRVAARAGVDIESMCALHEESMRRRENAIKNLRRERS